MVPARIVGGVLVVLLGLAGVIVAAIIGAWAVLRTRHPTPSQLELVDVAVPAVTADNDRAAVFDIKVRNIGGQPAVIKRLVVHIQRASPLYVPRVLPVYSKVEIAAQMMQITATYDVTLPSPEQLAVAMPEAGERMVIAPRDIRETITRFCRQVDEIRAGIDTDLAAARLAAADWTAAPPRRRDELPERLPSFEEYSVVFDRFWDPPRAIKEYMDEIEQRYRTLTEIGEAAAIVPESLRELMAQMRATLAELPSLRAEFG